MSLQIDFEVHRCEPVIDLSVRNLCRNPYHAHPRGCPNWGRKWCPPNAPNFKKFVDMRRPIYLCVNSYDLGKHAEIARKKHPEWSERALRNLRHWQGTARKQLRDGMKKFIEKCDLDLYDDIIEIHCPEAMGVNITETCKNVGIELEWPTLSIARQVAIIAYPSKFYRYI